MPSQHRTTDELLQAKQELAARLKAQITNLQSRKKNEDRKLDLRRKIVIGAAVMAHAGVDAGFREALRGALRVNVVRDADKLILADFIED